MVPATVERVSRNTPPHINARIRQQTVQNLLRYRGAPRAAIEQRLEELDQEWDIERALEANAACVILGGLALGGLDRRFLLLSATASAFLLQHSLQGWCPPLPLLRRLGFRTQPEIEAERLALRRMMAKAA